MRSREGYSVDFPELCGKGVNKHKNNAQMRA